MNEWQSDTDTRIRICEVQGMSVTYRETGKKETETTIREGRVVLYWSSPLPLGGADFH